MRQIMFFCRSALLALCFFGIQPLTIRAVNLMECPIATSSCIGPDVVETKLRDAVEKYAGGKQSGSIFSPKVRVFCHDKKGRGLRVDSNQTLKKDEIFLRLSLPSLFTSQSLMTDRFEAINHLDALALVLLEQSVLNNAYIMTLPLDEGVVTGFRMCDNDLIHRITDKELQRHARDMREMVQERADELVGEGFIRERARYEKALSVVQSRIFVVRAKKGNEWVKIPSLVMVADTINLALPNNANTDCQTNEESTHFECYATRDIRADEELLAPFETQGDVDMNSFTWFNYGFEFSPEEMA